MKRELDSLPVSVLPGRAQDGFYTLKRLKTKQNTTKHFRTQTFHESPILAPTDHALWESSHRPLWTMVCEAFPVRRQGCVAETEGPMTHHVESDVQTLTAVTKDQS